MCDFFHSTQYGFREPSSTTGTLFLDSSKAFYLVLHEYLLELELIGVRGVSLELIRSYLSNRKQLVSIKGHANSVADVNISMAQGSKLGPLLYLIFTNDLGKLPLKGKVMMFADNVAILYRSRDRTALIADIRHDMQLIYDYYETNELVLNLDKSKLMFFGRKSNNEFDDDDLTLVIDSFLNFKEHIGY